MLRRRKHIINKPTSFKHRHKVYYKKISVMTMNLPHCPQCHSTVKYGDQLTPKERSISTYICKCGYSE